MKRYVVDASVGAKWLIPEPDSDKALSLIARSIERIVPDLFFSEIGNILWKRARTDELSAEQAAQALQKLEAIPLTTMPVSSLMDLTFEIAAGYGRSFYDSAYLALAIHERAPLLTADAKLVRALARTPLEQMVFDLSLLSPRS
jgi:predicted nucleic acid-binding protein